MGGLKKIMPRRQNKSWLKTEEAFHGCPITCFASLPGAWIYPNTELFFLFVFFFKVNILSLNSNRNHPPKATIFQHTYRWDFWTRISENNTSLTGTERTERLYIIYWCIWQHTHFIWYYPLVSAELQLVGLSTSILFPRFSRILLLSFSPKLSLRR